MISRAVAGQAPTPESKRRRPSSRSQYFKLSSEPTTPHTSPPHPPHPPTPPPPRAPLRTLWPYARKSIIRVQQVVAQRPTDNVRPLVPPPRCTRPRARAAAHLWHENDTRPPALGRNRDAALREWPQAGEKTDLWALVLSKRFTGTANGGSTHHGRLAAPRRAHQNDRFSGLHTGTQST